MVGKDKLRLSISSTVSWRPQIIWVLIRFCYAKKQIGHCLSLTAISSCRWSDQPHSA